MFVGAGTQDSFPPLQSMITFEYIGQDESIQMSDMGRCEKSTEIQSFNRKIHTSINVENRTGDIVGLLNRRRGQPTKGQEPQI